MSLIPARSACLVCNSTSLQALLALEEIGVPHGAEGHKYQYETRLVSLCSTCGHGQMEKYSHDCWNHYEDEAWDMYWWFVLAPQQLAELQQLVDHCPKPLAPVCSCSLHQALRASCTHLRSTVRAATSPYGKAAFTPIIVEVEEGVPAFKGA